MKTLLLATLIASGIGATATAQEFEAVVPGGPIVEDERIYVAPPVEGCLQNAAREGNVLQAVNPLAPARYGSGAKYVAREAGDPFKNPNRNETTEYGVVLLAFEY